MSLCRGSSNELSQWSVFTKTWKCCGIKNLKLLTRFRADPTQKQSSPHLFDGVGIAAAPTWRNIHMRKLSVASYFASAIVLALCQFPTVCLVFVIVIDVLLFFLFLQESDKGQIFYWSFSRIMRLFDWLIDCHHAEKTSKLPYFRLFRPDTQILSALTALYWPRIAYY